MRMIDYLLNNYDTDADVRWLVDYHDIWLMPEVNPDGHHIVEAGGGGNSPYMYRKNGNNVGGEGCSWPPTAFDHFGVDNNRNFPFQWGLLQRLERFCVRPDLSRGVGGIVLHLVMARRFSSVSTRRPARRPASTTRTSAPSTTSARSTASTT